MASIVERYRKNGDSVFRVRLRKLRIPPFSLTFDDWEAAVAWMKKTENLYYKDPQYYFNWREELYYEMQEKRLKVKNNIVRPRAPRKV